MLRATLMIATVILAVSLSACTTPGSTDSVQSDVQAISQFTVADLQAADADAVATNDVLAHQCYPTLIKFIQSLPSSTSSTTVVGAFSAFQKARDLRNVAAGGIPDYLLVGCGPLYAQVHGDLLTFLAGASSLKL